MKLLTEKGEITLPEDFSFEIEVNNPFFSEEGTASVPAVLPATGDTFRIFGNIERPGKARRHTRVIPAILQHGAFQRKCNLVTESASAEDGISASLAFSESEMYSSIKEKNLKDIFAKEQMIFDSSRSGLWPRDGVALLYSDCFKKPIPSSEFSDIRIFPVATELEDGSIIILNEPDDSPLEQGFRHRTRTIRGVQVPNGYGVTPFLLLHVMLAKTFGLCGYNVFRNDFETSPFSSIVVLNNCADTLCYKEPGVIRMSNLVPSMTVAELISWLKDRFGAVVSVNHNELSIILIQNALSAAPDMDMSKMLQGAVAISYPVSSRVVLSSSTEIESAEPASETMDSLREKYDVIRDILLGEDPKCNCVVFRRQLGKFYAVTEYENASSYKETLLGSNCFTYDRKNSEETEEHSAKDRFVPEIDYNEMLMPYIGNRLHYNTSIPGENNDESQPLQICYAFWGGGCWYGSTQPYERDGTEEFYGQTMYPVLSHDGYYQLCWERYNGLLLNSAPEIEAQIDLDIRQLLSLDLMMPKLLNGQKVMIKSLTYEISESGTKCGKCILQLLPKYDDEIFDESISFEQNRGFEWRLVSTYSQAYDAALDKLMRDNSYPYGSTDGLSITQTSSDGLVDYTEADASEFAPAQEGIIDKMRDRSRSFRVYYYDDTGYMLDDHMTVNYTEYFISVYKESE